MMDRPFFQRLAALLLAVGCCTAAGTAQDGFGFGGENQGTTIGGTMEIVADAFMSDLGRPGSLDLADLVRGRLSLSDRGVAGEVAVKIRLSRHLVESDPGRILDEARLRVFTGNLVIEGGLMKLSWGKADSRGPLDVTNPLDLSDLSVTDIQDMKIPVPLLHLSLALGQATALDAVIEPGFEGYRLATAGVWEPRRIRELDAGISAFAPGVTYASLLAGYDGSTLDHAQAGLRITTTLAAADLGVQYFYGFLPLPAVAVSLAPVPAVAFGYNRYHQLGADAATVAAGFTLRAELAANITDDLAGNDPAVYNPTIAFSLGADRELFAGVTLNLQYAGTCRLANDRLTGPEDVDAASDAYVSTCTAVLMQKLLKDALEWKLTVLFSPNGADGYIMPRATWTFGDVTAAASAGIFCGNPAGDYGQYAEGSYLRFTLGYTF